MTGWFDWGEIEEEYYVAERQSETFVDGLPSWMSSSSSGGGSVTVSQDNMGSVTLSTGTSAAGDSASLSSTVAFDHTHDNNTYHGIGVSLRCGLGEGASDDGAGIVRVGLDGSGSPVKHIINHTDSSLSGALLSGNGGGTPTETHDKKSDFGTNVTQVFSDPYRGVCFHRYNDMLVSKSTDVPFGSTTFTFESYVETQDTSSDITLTIEDLEITYFTSLRR